MSSPYSVSMAKIIKTFHLETVVMPAPAENLCISNVEVNRPGLQLCGFYQYFDSGRIQVIGKSEVSQGGIPRPCQRFFCTASVSGYYIA